MRLSHIGMPLLIALLPLAGMAVLQFILPVLAPLLTATAGRPPEAFGWLAGAIGLGSITFLLTCHAILPCLGPVRTLRLGLGIAMAGVILVLVGLWPVMILGTFLIGFGYATTTPAGSQVLADFTPRALWGTLFSVRMAAVPVGGIVAGGLGGWVAAEHGWRTALVPVIGICLAAGLALFATPDRYNDSRPLKVFVAARLFDIGNIRRPWVNLKSIPGLTSLALGAWCLSWVHAVVTSFFVIYLHFGLGLPLERAAGLFALLQGFAIAGRILLGAIADRIGSPLPVLIALAPLSAASALMLAAMSVGWSPTELALGSIVIGLTVGTWNGLYLAEVARLAPAADVGEATASSAFFGFTAYLIAPPVAGALFYRIGFQATFQVSALFALAGLAVFLWHSRSPAGHRQRVHPARARALPFASAFGLGFGLALVLSGIALRGALTNGARAAPTYATPAQAVDHQRPAIPDLSFLLQQGSISPAGTASDGVTSEAALQRADPILAQLQASPSGRSAHAETEAAYWLRHALRGAPLPPKPMGWALTQLGSLLTHAHHGQPPDYASARQLWEVAGLLGDPIATCFDAQLYVFGLGVAIDLERARHLYAQARQRGGCPGADKALTALR